MKSNGIASGILKAANISDKKQKLCKFFGNVTYANIELIHEDKRYEGKDLCIKYFEDIQKKAICATKCEDNFLSWYKKVSIGEVLPVSLEQTVEEEIAGLGLTVKEHIIEENKIVETVKRAKRANKILHSSEDELRDIWIEKHGYEKVALERARCHSYMDNVGEGLAQQNLIKDFIIIPVKERNGPILNLWLNSSLTVDGGRCQFTLKMNDINMREEKSNMYSFDAGVMVRGYEKSITLLTEGLYTGLEAYTLTAFGIMRIEPALKEWLHSTDSKTASL